MNNMVEMPRARVTYLDTYGPGLEMVYQGACIATLIGKYELLEYIKTQKARFHVCLEDCDSSWCESHCRYHCSITTGCVLDI